MVSEEEQDDVTQGGRHDISGTHCWGVPFPDVELPALRPKHPLPAGGATCTVRSEQLLVLPSLRSEAVSVGGRAGGIMRVGEI